MLRILKERVVLWPVTVSVPADGGPERVEVKVRYRLLTRSDMDAIAERLRAVAAEGDHAVVGLVDTVLAERVLGWEGIEGEDGEPLAHSPEAVRALLDLPYLREAIESGLYAASRGASAKN